MLQQTQVATVIPYFLRFVEKFASIAELAAAPIDDVLALWSGLGYYSRARNLHKAAVVCVEKHDGDLPRDFDALSELPALAARLPARSSRKRTVRDSPSWTAM